MTMTKAELLAEAERLGVSVTQSMTLPEIRKAFADAGYEEEADAEGASTELAKQLDAMIKKLTPDRDKSDSHRRVLNFLNAARGEEAVASPEAEGEAGA